MIGFGGGCHWCTEAVFQPLIGVRDVRQGFIRADPPDDSWSEAVEVIYDPDHLSLRDLLTVHLSTHASTTTHKMRGKYRSAVYVQNAEHRQECAALIAGLGAETDMPFVTRVLMHRSFKPSDERFHNYYKSQPERPFCQTYIEPKLAKLRAQHKQLLQSE